ncbi:CsbD family protein [Stenotrophomonas sp. NPDC047960]|uniref:CsbD family protein n=1 Tax=Stenotrophomonas sp. NPDC047960 TaxID=3364531 RepID=UPI003714EDBD
MNKDIISGKWTQLKGKAQAKWGDLTDDDFKVAEGNAEYLAGRLQERYGWERDRAETEVKDFEAAMRKEYPDYH